MPCMDPRADGLRQLNLLRALSEATLGRIAEAVQARPFGPGELILLEGEPCRDAFFVAAGKVRVYRMSPSGRQQVMVQLRPGDAFNTVPAVQLEGRNHASVEGVTSGQLYAVPAAALRRLVLECPDLAMALLQDFADKLDHLTDLVEDLSLRTVRARLARFLLEKADREGVARRWTQDEMAARLGTVRDMVGRALRSFADAGYLRLDREQIVLLNREGLEAEAET
jgi:CRP/FNR family cyclic AMP-dependent transcriptional regulator